MPDRAPSTDPNEVPLVEEFRDAGPVAFEPRAVAGGRRSIPTLAGWAVAVVALIAIGVAGQHLGGPPSTEGRAAATAGLAPDASHRTNASERDPSPALPRNVDAIVLDSPAWGPVIVTSRRLYVQGIVNVRAVSLEVTLEGRGAGTVATEQVALPTVGDGVRPDVPPAFDAWFDLPTPRPNGTMWVTVTAYAADGFLLAGVRQPFLVGPVLEARAVRPR
jgi:hypothetical protein